MSTPEKGRKRWLAARVLTWGGLLAGAAVFWLLIGRAVLSAVL
jgi:hypothetical protein